MEAAAILIFCLVYLGLILGNLPGLALDRTGIALLGAIAFIELYNLTPQQISAKIDFSAIAILFSFMIISAQFYYSGFYTFVIQNIGNWTISPPILLLVLILVSGLLSAVLINDVVCLAMSPLIIRACVKRFLNPVPFLLGLACSSNIGSAITLIGNPQNMLIGQVLNVPFVAYMADAAVPSILGLFLAWWIIKVNTGNNWYSEEKETPEEGPKFLLWQSTKGIIIIVVILAIFLFFDVSRQNVALAGAGLLLLSRTMASRIILNAVDWQLLVLFIGLFVVNNSFMQTDVMHQFVQDLESHNINISKPQWLFSITPVLSNIVSNVPAVMLLLPFAHSNLDGSILALTSTLAGNMFIVGSIANIIVVAQAANFGVHISWRKHIQVGLPISLITLALAAGWLYFRHGG
jgi:Na+/H+ antiporter NhaD/arsenite permease-like protein